MSNAAARPVPTIELQGKAGRLVVNIDDYATHHADGYRPLPGTSPEVLASLPAVSEGATNPSGGAGGGDGSAPAGGVNPESTKTTGVDPGAAGQGGSGAPAGTGNQGGGNGSQTPVVPDYGAMDFAQLKTYAEEAGIEGFATMGKKAIAAKLTEMKFIPQE